MDRPGEITLPLGLLLAFTLCGCSAKPIAVAEIENMGGIVTVDNKSPDSAVIAVDLKKSAPPMRG